MGLNISRTVDIEISNKTRNITLMNPRTYFYSGYSLKSLQPSVSPGSSSTYKFINNSWFWGCNGVLTFEAESFTMAIYFSNPIDDNRFSCEMGLELSVEKVHRADLETAYNRLVRSSSSNQNSIFPSVILKESQEQAQLSAGPIKLTATMSRGRHAVIKVEVEEQRNWGSEDRMETHCRARQVQKREPAGSLGSRRQLWYLEDCL